MTASDPSMWEEQPHWDCSPKPSKGSDDALGCLFGRRMTRPQDDTTDASGGNGPRTITTRQAATLIAQGSGITRQPPGPKVIISMAFIVYTNPTPRYQTTTILGSPIEVEFTGLLGVFRTVLVCVSGCLLQTQELTFGLVWGTVP